MAQSESPLTRSFWLGSVDPRPLAIFRIALGLSILHDLADLVGDLRAFLTDDGVLPRWVYHGGATWSAFDRVSSPAGAGFVLALGAIAVVALTLGFKTRAATIASWLFISSLDHRNHFITDGGDAITRILLFWGMFTDLGAAYSVDARLRATRVVTVPAVGLRLLQLQVAMLYFGTSRLKLRAGWLHGDHIFYAMQLDGFVRPPGALLGRFPGLCRLATKAIVAMEGAFPIAAFSPLAIRTSRAVAVALGLAIQLGILLTMRVGIFTEVMLSSVALFVPLPWIDAIERWLRGRRWLRQDDRPTSTVELAGWARALQPLLAVQFLLGVWGILAARRFPLPAPVLAEVRFVDLEAANNLFDSVYDGPHWRADGVLADGTSVEVVSVVAPGAAQDSAAWDFSRWYKLTFKEDEPGFPLPEVGAYFCRTWDALRPGSPLRSFTLVDEVRMPRPPGTSTRTTAPRLLWRETCPR